MKKEVLIAILIGFGIGLLITFGIYRAQKAYQNSANSNEEIVATPEPTPQPTPFQGMTLTSPQNQIVQTESELFITGTVPAESYITAVTNEAEYYTQASMTGDFTLELTLEEGANLILLTSITPSGSKSEEELTVIYSPNLNDTANDQSTTTEDDDEDE